PAGLVEVVRYAGLLGGRGVDRVARSSARLPRAEVELIQTIVRPGRVHRTGVATRLALRQPGPVEPAVAADRTGRGRAGLGADPDDLGDRLGEHPSRHHLPRRGPPVQVSDQVGDLPQAVHAD